MEKRTQLCPSKGTRCVTLWKRGINIRKIQGNVEKAARNTARPRLTRGVLTSYCLFQSTQEIFLGLEEKRTEGVQMKET